MRIGIVPILDRASGGIYQYSWTMLKALSCLQSRGLAHEFYVLSEREPISNLTVPWPVLTLRGRASMRHRFKKKIGRLAASVLGEVGSAPQRASRVAQSDPYAPRFRRRVAERLDEWRIGLLIFPAPLTLSFESGFPYVMAIHDLQHRLQPEFPEVSADGEWEEREYLFRNGVRCSTLIIADSEAGREDILEIYRDCGADPDRVKVLPYLPAETISANVSDEDRSAVRIKYLLPERYYFYPAQFWPHKNHVNIVRALGALREAGRTAVHVVFSGFHGGDLRQRTFAEVMETARGLGVDAQIRYLGYVDDEDMPALYAEAVGLLMPTFFGPTNIPILEAWQFGCPVITSDIRGIREQVGDSALLAHPRSIEAISDSMDRLWNDSSLQRALAERGRKRLQSYTFNDYCARLRAIVGEAVERARA